METDLCIVCGAEGTPSKWGSPSNLCANVVCHQVMVDLVYHGKLVMLSDEELAAAEAAQEGE